MELVFTESVLSSGAHLSQCVRAHSQNEQGKYWRRNSFGGYCIKKYLKEFKTGERQQAQGEMQSKFRWKTWRKREKTSMLEGQLESKQNLLMQLFRCLHINAGFLNAGEIMNKHAQMAYSTLTYDGTLPFSSLFISMSFVFL